VLFPESGGQDSLKLGRAVCNAVGCQLLERVNPARCEKEVVMNIVRWNPFRELAEMEGRLNRFTRGAEAETFPFGDWVPAMDVKETETEYVVTADLPDVRKEEVKVNFYEGVLTIEGERKLAKEEKGETFHRIERGYGKFVRRFGLPTEVEVARVTAEFKNGVLTIHVPKAENIKPKAIEVKVA
jgi:HSP20 family protein